MHLRHVATTTVALLALVGVAPTAVASPPSAPGVPVTSAPVAAPPSTDGDVSVDDVPVVVLGEAGPTPDAVVGTPAPDDAIPVPDDAPLVAALAVPSEPDRTATPAVVLDDVQTVGVTWPEGTDASALDVQVRTARDGTWTDWVPLDVGESPDASTPDAEHATRGGTDSLWVGDAEAVQVSFDAAGATRTDDLSLALVGSPADAPAGLAPSATVPGLAGGSAAPGSVSSAATAAPTPPRVISRAEWGAPAQVCTPDVASGLVGAAVHHTAGSNGYTSVAEAEQQIRNDAAYHIQSRGWCDIGYNFIVDKWGNIYEGRAGSLNEPVIGVHAGGFNTGTVGVSMLGTYDSVPPLATQISVGRIIGWRLGAYRVDPRGTMSYTTGVGENSRYMNETVILPRVFGHRDVAYTACPGNGGYAALPAIRNTAWDASVEAWAQPPTSLLRTSKDSTVYLVSGPYRYPITNLATMGSLAPLGPVSFVAQQYLDAWTVGPAVRRVLLLPDGTVSFFDAGIRLAFGTCAQVTDFGLSCADAIPIDAAQTAALHNGGRMTNLYRTTTGKTFYVTGGTKREAADDASLTAAGVPTTGVRLLETGIAYLPYGDPLVRPGLVLHQRGGARTFVLDASAGSALTIPDAMRSVPGVPSTLGPLELDAQSLARIPSSGALAPLMRDGSGVTYFVSITGKARITDVDAVSSSTPAPVGPSSVLAAIPSAPRIDAPFFLKGDDSGTVYVVRGGITKPLRAWGDLVALNGGNPSPTIVSSPGALVRLIPTGTPYDPPGMMAKTATDGTVYLLDGADRRVTVSTFAVTNELGATRLAVVADQVLSDRETRSGFLRTIVQCDAQTYIGLGGKLWPVEAADRSAFPASATTLDATTCAALPHSARAVDRFWRTADGTIFWLDAGTKRPIGSYARFLELGGSGATMIQVSDFSASQVPTGARI